MAIDQTEIAKRIVEAFCDEGYQKKLTQDRLKIEEELKAFLIFLKSNQKLSKRVFEGIESRVKSQSSFEEKIRRKGYISSWAPAVSGADNIHVQSLISNSLPDLIGFRISCFFFEDEKNVYEELKNYFNNGSPTRISLEFAGKDTQANGHSIYKLKGTYDGEESEENINFELQIKSIFHNLWGEVEHKTIYKNINFDPVKQQKKIIVEQLFNILSASDKQLMSIFEQEYSEEMLLSALFYKASIGQIANDAEVDVLAIHYENFFKLFSVRDWLGAVKKYLGHKLLGNEFEKVPLSTLGFEVAASDPREDQLLDMIKERYIQHGYETICYIAQELYAFPDNDTVLRYLIQKFQSVSSLSSIDDGSSMAQDAFDDEDDNIVEPDYDTQETMMSYFDSFFKKRG